jgi:hypothetical protein
MKLHFGRHHLEGAFRAHRTLYRSGTTSGSAMLLLCYAVECGLKLVLLVRRELHTTARLADDDLTHDLDDLQRKVGCGHRLGHWQATQPVCNHMAAPHLHELFRYGGKMESNKLNDLRARLETIVRWIEEQGIL